MENIAKKLDNIATKKDYQNMANEIIARIRYHIKLHERRFEQVIELQKMADRLDERLSAVENKVGMNP